MEKTSYKQSEEAFQKNINATLQWFTETTTTILDVYSKQCELGIGIYKKLITASLNPNPNQDFIVINMEALINNAETAAMVTKKLIRSAIDALNIENGINKQNGFSDTFIKTILDTFIKHAKLIEQYNETYLEMLNKRFKNTGDDFATYLSNYKKTFQSNIEVAEESLKLVLENYTTLNSSNYQDKDRLIAEIDKLIDFLTGSMLKFWNEILKTVREKPTDEKKKQQDKAQTSQTKSKTTNVSDKKITIKQ